METNPKQQREYARVAVNLNVRFRLVESDEDAERLEQKLLKTPSVWALPGESELWKIADSPNSDSDGLLATALLALTAQVERVSRQLLDTGGPMELGEIVEISCAGAGFSTKLLLPPGSRLLISLIGEDQAVPPVRILAEVVHRDGSTGRLYGLVFKVMHSTDKKRLTRYIYGLQRLELRRASLERS